MTLIERVQEPLELEALARKGGACSCDEEEFDERARKEAKDLLEVLSGFQEGDANGLGVLIEWLDSMQKSSDFVIHPEIMQLLIRHRDEARGLEDRVTQLKMDCDQQHKHAMEWQEEAAKWRRIAIDRHAALLYTNDYTELAGKTNIWEKLDRGNQNEYRKEAARELETEATRRGPNEEKISASELDARWRYWQELAIKYRNLLPDGPLGDGPYIELTPERRAALEALSSMQTEITCPECGAWMGFDDIKPHMAALRAMLKEAGK